MTDLEYVRNAIGDNYKNYLHEVLSKGVQTVFDLPHERVVEDSLTAYSDGSVVSDSDYTVDYVTGAVTFDSAPDDLAIISFKYKHSGFTDLELSDMISEYGKRGAAIQAVRFLLADSARRVDYSIGSERMSASQIFEHLQKLLAQLISENTTASTDSSVRLETRISSYDIVQNGKDSDYRL